MVMVRNSWPGSHEFKLGATEVLLRRESAARSIYCGSKSSHWRGVWKVQLSSSSSLDQSSKLRLRSPSSSFEATLTKKSKPRLIH
ncbi:hypothetical protein TNCV_3935021 [Trichonephila clavipes]|nr:hypothetical protein TNCV_3935021 [Trichonephila clavipes]